MVISFILTSICEVLAKLHGKNGNFINSNDDWCRKPISRKTLWLQFWMKSKDVFGDDKIFHTICAKLTNYMDWINVWAQQETLIHHDKISSKKMHEEQEPFLFLGVSSFVCKRQLELWDIPTIIVYIKYAFYETLFNFL